MGSLVIRDIGGAVASAGARVVGAVGDLVGSPDPTCAWVGSVVTTGVGTTGAIDGGVVSRGTSVGGIAWNASTQISLPPIISTLVMLAHCWAF